MGVAIMESNIHREGSEESTNLIETIKSLQSDVQSYKTNNERFMKTKEQQYGFKIKML
jgi:hypothetical protein